TVLPGLGTIIEGDTRVKFLGGFIEYLKGYDMLEDYLVDHKAVVKRMPSMLVDYVKHLIS
ncbi:hypothetical protein ABRT01_18110, partial [Lentibacillus sp. L22]